MGFGRRRLFVLIVMQTCVLLARGKRGEEGGVSPKDDYLSDTSSSDEKKKSRRGQLRSFLLFLPGKRIRSLSAPPPSAKEKEKKRKSILTL